MSQKKKVDMSKLPKDENGMTEIDRSAEEAYEDGSLEMIDILGNKEPFSKKQDIIHEMLTGAEKPVEIHRVLSIVKHLQGKVLTVVDATYLGEEKRLKFIKDLVKDAFSSSSNWLYEMSIREFEKPKKE